MSPIFTVLFLTQHTVPDIPSKISSNTPPHPLTNILIQNNTKQNRLLLSVKLYPYQNMTFTKTIFFNFIDTFLQGSRHLQDVSSAVC